MTPAISPQEYEQLSAYMDGVLTEAERTRLEARLAAEPALQAALDDLRATAQILRAAPELTPPRSFTLDPARYRRSAPWWMQYRLMQTVGALGTLASILLIAFGLFSSTMKAPLPASMGSQPGVVALQPTIATTPTMPVASTLADATQNELDANKSEEARTATQHAARVFSATSTALPIPTRLPSPVAIVPTVAPIAPAMIPSGPSSDTAQTGALSGAGQPQPTQVGQADAAGNQPPSNGSRITATPAPTMTMMAVAQESSDSAAVTATPTQTATATPMPSATASPAMAKAAATLAATSTAAAERGGGPADETTQGTALAFATGPQPATATAQPTIMSGERDSRVALVSGPQFLLIFGLALLIFSIALIGIGWMRSRL